MKAEIKLCGNSPVLHINDEPFPPMAMTARTNKHDYMKRIRQAGIRVFFVFANTDWMRPHKETTNSDGTISIEKSGFETFCDEVEHLLEAVPDAYIIVRIGLHPPVEWVKNHPDDIVRYDDGSHIPCEMCSEIHYDYMPGSYSLCSDNWRRDASTALENFCDEVDNSKFSEHIAGYFLAAGGTSEWYYMNRLVDITEHAPDKPDCLADTSVAFQKVYTRFLKEKYKSLEMLRFFWKDPLATFENPHIPSLKEREYVTVDQPLIARLRNLECVGNNFSDSNSLNDDLHLGVFLNAEKCRSTYDFHSAWHEGTADSIIRFAKKLKERYNNTKVVGAFYGSLACTDYFDSSTTTGTEKILDSGYVDFLAAPGVYNNREPGGCTAQRELQDSFALRGKLFVAEDDIRTHLDNDFFRDSMRVYNSMDSINVLKREFGRNLCQGTYAWWFDQFSKGGRYDDPDILNLFARQQQIACESVHTLKKKNEIAILCDPSSIHYVSKYTSAYQLDFYRTSDLNSIGAGTDYYFLHDMMRKDMPDYKLYIMINAFSMGDELRSAVMKKAAVNAATVLWLYAPGFINPDRPSMNNENIFQVTGMNVKRIDGILSPRFDITADHPAVRYAVEGRKYGYIDHDVYSNVWLGSNLTPEFLNPGFYIEEDSDTTVLGRYCINGRAALAIKKYQGFNSLYCAPQIMRHELLRSAAEFSGCHIYSYDGDCLYVNEDYICIHASYTGTHSLYFKNACNPYEVYEHKYYGKNVDSINLNMYCGQTLMIRLERDNSY